MSRYSGYIVFVILDLKLESHVTAHVIVDFAVSACISAAYAVVRYLTGWVSVSLLSLFVYCVETAKVSNNVLIKVTLSRQRHCRGTV